MTTNTDDMFIRLISVDMIVVDKTERAESHQHTWKSVHAKKYLGSKSVWKKYKKYNHV